MQKKTVLIIVLCYNEEALPHFCKEFNQVVEGIKDYDVDILLINDGLTATDDTLLFCRKLSNLYNNISFSRNFGKEAVMYAGFCNVYGDYVAVIDTDMQDSPTLLSRMFEILESSDYDSVATRRVNRRGNH